MDKGEINMRKVMKKVKRRCEDCEEVTEHWHVFEKENNNTYVCCSCGNHEVERKENTDPGILQNIEVGN